jgi:hypothetical protein
MLMFMLNVLLNIYHSNLHVFCSTFKNIRISFSGKDWFCSSSAIGLKVVFALTYFGPRIVKTHNHAELLPMKSVELILKKVRTYMCF